MQQRLLIAMASVLCVGMLCSCASGGGPGQANGGDTPDFSSARGILKALSVKEVDAPPAVAMTTTLGTVQAVDPGSWQPLRYDRAVFWPHAELIAVGPEAGADFVTIFEDGDAAYAGTTLWPSDDAWANTGKTLSCGGDFDADGIEEGLFLTWEASGWNLRRYDSVASAQTISIPTTIIPAGFADNLARITDWYALNAHMTACQLDADDAREFAVALGDTVWLFDVDASTPAAWSVSLRASRDFDQALYGFAAGDCDGDGLDEFCATTGGTASWGVFETGLDTSPSGGFIILPGFYSAYCAFGDVDGDNLDEVVVNKLVSFTSFVGFSTTCVIYEWDGSAFAANPLRSASVMSESTGSFVPVCLDMTGDGTDEVFCTQTLLYDWKANEGWKKSSPLDVWDARRFLRPLQAADVDGDGREDLLGSYVAGGSTYSCEAYSLADSGTALEAKHAYYSGRRSTYPPAVVALNADDDSPLVEYAGHRLTFSNPIVLASLAAAPYHQEIADSGAQPYAYDEWSTSYGTYTSTTGGSSTKVAFSVGGGVQGEMALKLFGYSIAVASYSIIHSEQFSWQWDASVTETKSIDYIGAGGQDIVLFAVVPVDEYAYKVLQSPDPAELNTLMKITVPRRYSIYPVTRRFYNANNGALEDVAPPHAYGNPWSYPGPTQRDELMASAPSGFAYRSDWAANVAEASGASGSVTELTIDVAENASSSFTWDQNTAISGAAGTEALQVVAQLGFGTGYTTSESWTTGTRFGGTVGYLPTAFYNAGYTYASGLFAYKQPTALGQAVWMVEYWVE